MLNHKKTLRIFLCTFFFSALLFAIPVFAKPLDEIENYTVMVEVEDDAKLEMTYHIEWKVLDSDAEGPLSWIRIGVPNKRYVSDVTALSDTIRSIRVDGDEFRIDLDRNYYEGETVSFDFRFRQDYLYQVDKLKEGYTVYTYTPGWFDDIAVDELIILWDNEKMDSFIPEAEIQSGVNVWMTSLSPGEKFTVSVTYPNDAYGFDLSRTEEPDDHEPWFLVIIYFIITIISSVFPIGIIWFVITMIGYALRAGFGEAGGKKITRTKIEYYDACPGCGGTREKGKDVCAYCGKSMIKKTETVTEEQLKKEYKDAANYTKSGDYQLGSSGNVFLRVHSVTIPRSSSGGRSSGRSHSSCAHSSCACACACACAGGGRAGCTNKDFYRTDLKLKYFKVK
ncbi:MAG: hypothetical protein IKS87_08605 [Lachnospiraceae bacterium]|nr:hypothetical protein [Lachnospiraceae bacterium]